MTLSRTMCLIAVAGAAYAQLMMEGIRCGQLTCQTEEYCNLDTNRCSSCNVVCNGTNHNHDFGLCAKECLSYLLNLRYVQKSESSRSSLDVTSVAQQAQAALIISGSALAVLLLILIITCRGSLVPGRIVKQRFQPAENSENKTNQQGTYDLAAFST